MISFGRNNKNDIIFNDISVSRVHSYLHWINNEIYLYDNNSKFGTLKLVKNKVNLFNINK